MADEGSSLLAAGVSFLEEVESFSEEDDLLLELHPKQRIITVRGKKIIFM